MKTKICTKCKKEKSLNKFYKATAHLDGLTYYCKSCIKIKNKEYLENHHNINKQNCLEYYNNHKEERKEYNELHKDKENSRRRKNYKMTRNIKIELKMEN